MVTANMFKPVVAEQIDRNDLMINNYLINNYLLINNCFIQYFSFSNLGCASIQ